MRKNSCLGFRVQGLGFRVLGFGFRVATLFCGSSCPTLTMSLEVGPTFKQPWTPDPKTLVKASHDNELLALAVRKRARWTWTGNARHGARASKHYELWSFFLGLRHRRSRWM